MLAIWKREVQSFFLSPLAYIFIGAFMVMAGIMFVAYNISQMSVSFASTLSSMTFVFMLLVPILTMKLISEDRRTKTDQLLLTAPLTVFSIVLGKYLAAVTVFATTLVISFIFPGILAIFGMPAFGEIVAGYLGFFMLGCSLIAVGVFISSVTENQVISALVTFFVLLIMWIGNVAISAIPFGGAFGKFIVNILEWFLVYSRLSSFSLGLLSVTPVIYFFSFTFVFLFLAVRSIEKRRWSEG